jgi:sporulation protein YlmC with PRC-barrel domain
VSVREIRVTDLIGRRVRDRDGRSIGRVEELVCEIQLRAEGRDYLVREIHVGTVGFLEAVGGSALARALFRTVGRGSGYTRYRVPWEALDLTDAERPRVTISREEMTVM